MAGARRLVMGLAGGLALAATGCGLDSRLLYVPRPHDEATWREIARRHGAQALQVERDGVLLRGWLLRPADAPPGARLPVVIYFGGNAEETSWMLGPARRIPRHAFVAVNYRGYGASTGTAHESVLHDDALAIHDRVAARDDVDPSRIVVWGRSLGTGVATGLAARRPVSAVVLSSPYDSMTALARHHLPALAFLLGQPFDSIALAPSIRAPLLALVAGRDTVVPPVHSERLVAAWAGPARTVRLAQAGHDDLHEDPAYWPAVLRFLANPRAPS